MTTKTFVYDCFYKSARCQLEASTTYEAQTLAAKKLKAKKQHQVSVFLTGKKVDNDQPFTVDNIEGVETPTSMLDGA